MRLADTRVIDDDIDIAPFLDDLLQAILQCGLIANVHGKELSSGL